MILAAELAFSFLFILSIFSHVINSAKSSYENQIVLMIDKLSNYIYDQTDGEFLCLLGPPFQSKAEFSATPVCCD